VTGSKNTKIAPCLAETFVEQERFTGSCYRAANWLLVGQTCGRSRHDRLHPQQGEGFLGQVEATLECRFPSC
jgi:Domain of unknown function (DUF4338)